MRGKWILIKNVEKKVTLTTFFQKKKKNYTPIYSKHYMYQICLKRKIEKLGK